MDCRRRPDALSGGFAGKWRNESYGAEKFGFKDLSGVHVISTPSPASYLIAARRHLSQGGSICAETGAAPAAARRGTAVDALPRTSCGGTATASHPGELPAFMTILLRMRAARRFTPRLYGGGIRHRIGDRALTSLSAFAGVHSPASDPPGGVLSSRTSSFNSPPTCCRSGRSWRYGATTPSSLSTSREDHLIGTVHAGEMKVGLHCAQFLSVTGRHADALLGHVGTTATSHCSSPPAPARRWPVDPNRASSATMSTAGPGRVQLRGLLRCASTSEEAEPEIYAATNRFTCSRMSSSIRSRGCISTTIQDENTRSAYPLEFTPKACAPGRRAGPRTSSSDRRRVGVTSLIAKLTPAQR
jgi:hypothetical protein